MKHIGYAVDLSLYAANECNPKIGFLFIVFVLFCSILVFLIIFNSDCKLTIKI